MRRHSSHTKQPTELVDPIGLLRFVVTGLLPPNTDFDIRYVIGPYSLVLELKLDSDCMGRVIGKHGRIVKNIRHLLQALPNKKVLLGGQVEQFRQITLEVID